MIRFKYLCPQNDKNRLQMNKGKIIITFFLLLVLTYAKGQDKIVTTQGDTIFCKIVSVSLDFIKYEQKDLNQMPVIYSVPKRQVQEYSLGPRTEKPVPESQTRIEPAKPLPPLSENKKDTKPFSTPEKRKQAVNPFSPVSYNKPKDEAFPRWRAGIQGGASYLINSLAYSRQAMKDLGVYPTTQADDYYKKLRVGLSAGADVYYLVSRVVGVGVKYSGFTSSVLMDYTVNPNSAITPPVYYSVSEKERFYMNYVGPAVLWQQWLGGSHKFRLNEELSVGYIFFRDQIQFNPYQYVFVNPSTKQKQYNVLKKGNTYSGTVQLSLEYYPASSFSIGLNAGGVPAIFRSLNVLDNNGSNYEETLDKSRSLDLSRVDCSISFRFHF